jgi:hypothetical protein
MQTLYMTPQLRAAVYAWSWSPTTATTTTSDATKEASSSTSTTNGWSEAQMTSRRRSIPLQLQRLFGYMQCSEKSSLYTRDLTSSFGWNNDEVFDQHDVSELLTVLIAAIEDSCRGTPLSKTVTDLYRGTLR